MSAMMRRSVDNEQELERTNFARAVLNILEDTAADKTRLRDAQRAVLNILEDSGAEKLRLEQMQKAVLNILADLGVEVEERKQAQTSLLQLNAELDARVQRRTAALEMANRELGAFSYSVSHDLRAPLRAIDGFGKRLAIVARDKLDSTALHYLDRIRTGTQVMSQLIEDLLSLSHVSRTELAVRPFSLSGLAQRVANELRRSEPGRTVAWSIAGEATVAGDERLLEIALQNLLGNAWKFTSKRDHARIEFGMTPREGEMVFFVRDNGAGFDTAYADKLFAPFQRLHGAAEFPGTGIGLATTRRIIQRHGGRVWADAKVNEGATFFFTLGKGAEHGITADIAG